MQLQVLTYFWVIIIVTVVIVIVINTKKYAVLTRLAKILGVPATSESV